MSQIASVLFKRCVLNQCVHNGKINPFNHANCVRSLYAQSTLGIDGYLKHKDGVKEQFVTVSDKFRERMKEYTQEGTKSMIFTDDLKNMVHLAEDADDVDLVMKMIKRFSQQNKELRFGNFIFGPVVMRMFHFLNKYEEAVECFKNPDLGGFFDQLISYQILLDLLYENQKYETMLEVFKLIEAKQILGIKYPKNVVVLVLAACYRMNTKESCDFALQMWSDFMATGHMPMRRAITFAAALAINFEKYDIALEMLTLCRSQTYTTIRNLKVLALANLGRLDDAISVFKNVLLQDVPVGDKNATFNHEVVNKVKEIAQKSNNPEYLLEIERIEKNLQAHGQLVEYTLQEQLCQEIVPIDRTMPDRFQYQNRRPVRFQNQRNDNRDRIRNNINFNRPGLHELQ